MQLLHPGFELAREGRTGRRLRQQPRIDQLIQQQRVRGDLRREEIPVTAQLHQARARRAVLSQQREVRRALARRLDDGEDPSQHRQLGAAPRHVCEQRRQQRLQALAPGLIELAHQGRGAQLQQQARDFRAVCETGARQRLRQRGGFRLAVPESSQIDAHGARIGLRPALHQQAKVAADPCAVRIELLRERGPVARIHGERQALARQRLRRQRMDLRVGEHLQAVLEPAQMDIGRPQFARGLGRQLPRLPEARQRGEERGSPQALVPAPAGELQRLHDEFDFADPARTELYVIGKFAPLHFALDESLHLPQALEHAVVEIAAVDERPYRCRVNFRITLRTADRAGLDVRVPLPVAPVARQVILEGGEARHQGTRVPEGP